MAVITSIGHTSNQPTTLTTATPSSCSTTSTGVYSVSFSSAPSGVSVGDMYHATDGVTSYTTYSYLVQSISGSTLELRYITDDGGMMSSGAVSPCDVYDYDQSYNMVTATGTFKRAYSTITLWEAGLDDSDIYSSGSDAEGHLFADSDFNEAFTINGGSTVGLNSIKLTSHDSSGNRHDGTAGSGAKIRYTGNTGQVCLISRNDVEISWVEFDMGAGSNNSSNNRAVHADTNAYSSIVVSHNIVHDLFGSFPIVFRFDGGNSSSDTRYLHNNIAYDIDDSDDRVKFFLHNGDYPVSCWNNSVYKLRTGRSSKDATSYFSWANTAVMELKNNLSIQTASTGTPSFGSNYSSSSDYNATDLSSATAGANDLVNLTSSEFVSVTPNAEDLHLSSTASSANAGVSIGSTAGVDIDIDGVQRSGTWSIGADFVAPANVNVALGVSSFGLESSGDLIHGSMVGSGISSFGLQSSGDLIHGSMSSSGVSSFGLESSGEFDYGSVISTGISSFVLDSSGDLIHGSMSSSGVSSFALESSGDLIHGSMSSSGVSSFGLESSGEFDYGSVVSTAVSSFGLETSGSFSMGSPNIIATLGVSSFGLESSGDLIHGSMSSSGVSSFALESSSEFDYGSVSSSGVSSFALESSGDFDYGSVSSSGVSSFALSTLITSLVNSYIELGVSSFGLESSGDFDYGSVTSSGVSSFGLESSVEFDYGSVTSSGVSSFGLESLGEFDYGSVSSSGVSSFGLSASGQFGWAVDIGSASVALESSIDEHYGSAVSTGTVSIGFKVYGRGDLFGVWYVTGMIEVAYLGGALDFASISCTADVAVIDDAVISSVDVGGVFDVSDNGSGVSGFMEI